MGIFMTCCPHSSCLGSLYIERPWSTLAGPFLSRLAQMGVETTTFVGASFLELKAVFSWEKHLLVREL